LEVENHIDHLGVEAFPVGYPLASEVVEQNQVNLAVAVHIPSVQMVVDHHIHQVHRLVEEHQKMLEHILVALGD